jgi:hypothetical protein
MQFFERYFERVLASARLRIHDAAACEDVTRFGFTIALGQLGSSGVR